MAIDRDKWEELAYNLTHAMGHGLLSYMRLQEMMEKVNLGNPRVLILGQRIGAQVAGQISTYIPPTDDEVIDAHHNNPTFHRVVKTTVIHMMTILEKLWPDEKQLLFERERLLEACKMAYRKHHLKDESIGWDELGIRLLDTICDVIGDDGYAKWLETTKKEKERSNHVSKN